MLHVSLRRYAAYIGLAVCILITLNYLRSPFSRGDVKAPQTQLDKIIAGGQASLDAAPEVPVDAAKDKRFRWSTVPKQYPVRSLTSLPTGAPQVLPKVQHSFQGETAMEAGERRRRQDAVKSTFLRCWEAYRHHAWMRDEVAPLSGGSRDSFGGWGASLVDNLDNLWIMGLKDEFDNAVKAATDIDLGRTTIEIINVFETTIRHLGGFLSAYDLSGDRRCLDLAKDFGEMLLKAFDTPNHLPITRWRPQAAQHGKQQADELVLVAEIGSLTMEFTRLSQVTGDMRWYDAVERIVQIFDAQQDKSLLPGMWPVTVNAREADFSHDTFFTLSAMSDSLYEYFPKMHALLGGTDPRYKKLYEKSMATAIQYNLFRPMTPDDADILVSGNIRKQVDAAPMLEPQGQHLACFTGGMFALGGKLFSNLAHVEIGRKLTDGCIWTYQAMPLGIMPEVFEMIPCPGRTACKWNETAWEEGRDLAHALPADEVPKPIERVPKGFAKLNDRRYILRPEAIESVFLLYRMTGQKYFQDKAWEMFESITKATQTQIANAALRDVSYSWEDLERGTQIQFDSMESFWMAETLKYFYLIFSEPDVINLDEWVFNTEAHPFKRPVA